MPGFGGACAPPAQRSSELGQNRVRDIIELCTFIHERAAREKENKPNSISLLLRSSGRGAKSKMLVLDLTS